LNKEIRLIITVAILLTTNGSFRTNRYCNAFTIIEECMVRSRQSSFSTKVGVGLFDESSSIRTGGLKSISVSYMTSSSEDNEVATMGKDGPDTAQAPVTIEDKEYKKTTPPFDKSVWSAYERTMGDIMTQRRVRKKCDDETVSKCRGFLLSYEEHLSPIPDIVEIVSDSADNKRETLALALRQQAGRFHDLFNFTNAEVEYMNRCLVYMGDACAKILSKKSGKKNTDSDSHSEDDIDPRLPIAVAWHKLKEMGYVIRENSMSTYMYILSSSSSCGDNIENDAFVDDALLQVVTCHDTIYEPSEKTVTIRLKSFIARGKIDEAEDMFSASFKGGGKITSAGPATRGTDKPKDQENTRGRLRTYMPLMEHYCMSGNLSSTLRLYRQMQECAGVHWDVESYSLLLSSLARFGFFFSAGDRTVDKSNASQNDSDENLPGPNLFDMLASNMAEDILELTEKTSIQLADAFQIGINDCLGETRGLENAEESEDQATETVVVKRVEIPKGNGSCPVTGVKLRLLALDDLQRQHVHDTLLEMSRTTTEEFMAAMKAKQQKPKKGNRNRKQKIRDTVQDTEPDMESYGYEELLKFSTWLDDREGPIFTTIVDGANVAYYGRSNVHYSSLKKVVEKLESMGERPLVVMPEKYTSKSWACRPNFYQKRTQKDEEVIEWLKDNEMMYIVPRLNLDDYFWMLASVSNQTKATERDDMNIPVGNDQGRFPGMRPMLITNDQMRDHKLDLLEPREFRRWSSCHIVNYDMEIYEKDEWEEERKISFVPADSFSREIQSNLHENGKDTVWHFPIGDSLEWLCISIKR